MEPPLSSCSCGKKSGASAKSNNSQKTKTNSNFPCLQKPAPDFKGTAVIDWEFKEISLNDFKGSYLVLLFYPADFSALCPTELIGLSDGIGDFKKINTQIVACSTDSEYCHFSWQNMPRKEAGLGKIDFPMLSDKSFKISRAYGVLDEETGNAYRGLFIIDDKGILRQVMINDNPIARSMQETLRLVQALQYFEANGELCPLGWQPGEKGITPK